MTSFGQDTKQWPPLLTRTVDGDQSRRVLGYWEKAFKVGTRCSKRAFVTFGVKHMATLFRWVAGILGTFFVFGDDGCGMGTRGDLATEDGREGAGPSRLVGEVR